MDPVLAGPPDRRRHIRFGGFVWEVFPINLFLSHETKINVIPSVGRQRWKGDEKIGYT
ncbi:MAG: hypothetical protein HS100_10635 [Anaerolineales bacterium]|nr:hypothetical protein [Anaerolineales bacterium]